MPTTRWTPGQVILDEYELSLPEAAGRDSRLEIGLYDEATGERVSIGSADRLELAIPWAGVAHDENPLQIISLSRFGFRGLP